jgi:hypothetical protein
MRMRISNNRLGLRGRPGEPHVASALELDPLRQGLLFREKEAKSFIGAVAGSSGKLRVGADSGAA